jgi:DNA polymerase I-like protein with 3'-5' exonuclease and polymerase domains
MIYLVTGQQQLSESDLYKVISIEESLQLLNSCKILQYDSETSCKNPYFGNILCIQFGNKEKDFQLVVDTTTIDILKYKDILETKPLIGHNLKFDLQWLYNHKIIPRKVYDTMIVEQLLYLGYPAGIISFSLASIAQRRLNIDIDKSIRGQIIWRGLDTQVIVYAANDVKWLEDIMWAQVNDCKERNCLVGAKLECDFVPAISYLEWSGIKLDENKWKEKMKRDQEKLNKAEDALNKFVINTKSLSKFCKIDNQGDLFTGFDTEPKCIINWSSSRQVVQVAKILGFDTTVQDKKTGEDKDSVLEKHLSNQKGINDEFIKLYFDYQEQAKLVSSFGQSQLNMINPKTGRCHTVYKQLGASSGRMSCGSQQPNEDLAKVKKLKPKECTYCNFQQLPHDEFTRSCFISEKGNMFVSCDYSAQEGRVQGDIYQDEAILKMYREGIDGHSMYAKIFFKDELKDIDVHDVKKLRPDLRSKAKGPEFALAYGGGYTTIMQSLKCSEEEALTIVRNYEEGFKGTIEFAKKGSAFVRKNGYIVICPATGHRMYWWDHDKWLERQKSFTPEFWEEYKTSHKGTNSLIAQEVREHFQAASKWDRMARNACTQGELLP